MDWNNDGKQDLLVGDGEGKISIFLNTGNDENPVFNGGSIILSGNTSIDVGDRAAPVAEDWNGDEKKDLLIGNFDGTITVCTNGGTDSAPLFGTHYLLQAGGKDLKLSTRLSPRIYDWNKDGLKDLLAGEAGGYVYYLKNIGTNKAPVFGRYEKLFLVNGEPLRYPDPSGLSRSRLFVTDWNKDGLADIVVGGKDGRVMLFTATEKTSFTPGVYLKRTWNHLKETAHKIRNVLSIVKNL
ncbi:MAG: VCBS repeat-containing protein [Nitrospirae bacterium]|nr:VCBS repeat-containing protein [Nitrospirota bacterium]